MKIGDDLFVDINDKVKVVQDAIEDDVELVGDKELKYRCCQC